MTTNIRLSGSQFVRLRELLFTDDGCENAAVLHCGRLALAGETIFLGRSVSEVALHEYNSRLPSHLEVSAHAINRAIDQALPRRLSIVIAHSHPTTQRARFSHSDAAGEERLMPVLWDVLDVPNGTMVLSLSDWAGHVWNNALMGDMSELQQRGVRIVVDRPTSTRRDSDDINETHDRQRRIWGLKGQQQLGALRVGLVGVGGLGSAIAEQIARLGVRDVILVDRDVVDNSNISRMYGTDLASVGQSKVSVVGSHMQRVGLGSLKTRRVEADVTRHAVLDQLRGCDVILSSTDNLLSRSILNRFSYQYLIPVIDAGVRVDVVGGELRGASGRVTLVGPDLACLRCSGHLDADVLREELLSESERDRLILEGYVRGSWEPQPAVISLNSTVAGLAVTALLNLVNSFQEPLIEQIYDVTTGTVFRSSAVHDPGCDICSSAGLIGLGDAVAVTTFD